MPNPLRPKLLVAGIAGLLAASTPIASLAGKARSSTPFATSPQATTGLRCHYRLAHDPTGASASFVQVAYPLAGYWHNASILASRSLFFTDDTPQNVRKACLKAIAQVPEAGEFIGAGASTGSQSYNYEIWYNGDQRPDSPIERIVSFGDSLSDTGNVHNESQWLLPSKAWMSGRFSNGRTWIEHLAMRNDIPMNNWSVGGAQTENAYFGLFHGLEKQVEGFLEYSQQAKRYDMSRTLFTVLIAGNDFVNDTQTGPEIIRQQENGLRKLADRGARKILIVNLPDVSAAPVFRMGRTDAHIVAGKVDYYNAHIGDVARRVASATGAEIRVVDVRSSFDDVLARPSRYGFVNTTQSCLKIESASAINYVRTPSPRPECDASRYVFWDTLHPTERMHALMADWVTEYTQHWGIH